MGAEQSPMLARIFASRLRVGGVAQWLASRPLGISGLVPRLELGESAHSNNGSILGSATVLVLSFGVADKVTKARLALSLCHAAPGG